MHILHITTYLQGGAGRLLCGLALAQRQRGFDVAVCASRTDEGTFRNYPEYLEQLRHAQIPTLLVDSTFKRDLHLITQGLTELQSAIGTRQLDVIHAHAAVPALTGLLLSASRVAPVPVVQTMHGWAEHRDPHHLATDVAIMNQLAAVVACAETSRKVLQRAGVSNAGLTVIPNGIHPSSVNEPLPSAVLDALRTWRSAGTVVLCCIGEVGPRKNQRLLLDALRTLETPRPVACLFVGDGHETLAREARITTASVAGIVFAGHIAAADRVLPLVDWLVLPSRREGLPLSVLEAYARRVPVIVSDIPELLDVCDHGVTGLVFQNDDIDSLRRTIQRAAAMDDAERRPIAAAAESRWRQYYSESRMVDAYAALYDGLHPSDGALAA